MNPTTATPAPIAVMWQFSGADGYVQPELDGADRATAFNAGSEVVLSVVRSSRGKWMFDTSDHFTLVTNDRLRWATPAAALDYFAGRSGLTVEVVEEW